MSPALPAAAAGTSATPAPAGGRRPGLLAGVSAYWSASLLGLVATFVRSSVCARLLGPTDTAVVGQLSLLLTLAAVVGGFGLATAGTRAVAAAEAERPDGSADLSRALLLLPAGLSGLLAVAAMAAAGPLGHLLLGRGGSTWLVVAALAAVPATVLAPAAQAVLLGRQEVGTLARAGVESAVVSTAVTVLLAEFAGLTGVALSMPLGAAASAAVYLARSRFLRRAVFGRARVDPSALRSLAGIGTASVVAAAATTLADTGVRSLLVHARGLHEAGLYQPAYLVSTVAFAQLATALAAVLLPRLSADIAAGRVREAVAALERGLLIGLGATAAGALLVVVLRTTAVDLAFGAPFRPGADSLALQTLGEVPRVFCYTLGAVLLPLGRVRAWVTCGLSATVIRTVAAVVMVDRLGASGLALSFTLEWTVIAVATAAVTWGGPFRVPGDLLVLSLLSGAAPVAGYLLDRPGVPGVHWHLGWLAAAAVWAVPAWLAVRRRVPGHLPRVPVPRSAP